MICIVFVFDSFSCYDFTVCSSDCLTCARFSPLNRYLLVDKLQRKRIVIVGTSASLLAFSLLLNRFHDLSGGRFAAKRIRTTDGGSFVGVGRRNRCEYEHARDEQDEDERELHGDGLLTDEDNGACVRSNILSSRAI